MKMRKIIALVLVLAFGFMFVAACSDNTTPAAEPPLVPGPGPAHTPEPATPPTTDDGDDDDGDEPPSTGPVVGPRGTGTPIVIYSNSFTDERLEWLTERAGQDGFVIQGVAAGGGATADRLIAEKHNPIADVVFGLNIFLWQSLIDNDVIVPYVPAWANEIPAGLNNPHGYFHALVIQAILLAYDTAVNAPPPTDWLDLWTNPIYHGHYQFETALTGGTTRMVIAGILSRYIDPSGHMGISDAGWSAIEAYYANGFPNFEGVDLYARMADPDSPVYMGQIWHAGIPMREEEHGLKTHWPVPSVGVPFVVEGIAEIKGANNPEEARLFIEWFGTAQIQIEWQERFDSLPANVHATHNLDEFQHTISALPIQEIDWDYVAENFDRWAEHIMLTYMP